MLRKCLIVVLLFTLIILPTIIFTQLSHAEKNKQGKIKVSNPLPKYKGDNKKEVYKFPQIESDSTAIVYNETMQPVKEIKIRKNIKTDHVTTARQYPSVLIAADEEYRAAHPDWQILTTAIVESADDSFFRLHNIDFQVRGFLPWTSTGNDGVELLYNLNDQPFNTNKYDFLVGFTKDPVFEFGGIAFVYGSKPSKAAVSLNLDQGIEATWLAAEHEFSHNFGLGHDPSGSGIICMMNYDYSYAVDFWDPFHDNQIEQNKVWYGQ